MIDLNKVISELESYKNRNYGDLTVFKRAVIDDAIDMLTTEVIDEHEITKVGDITELSTYINQGKRATYLTTDDFLHLIQNCSIGLCCTWSIFKRYLEPSEFELWENDELDMSRFRGHDKNLEDVYLEAKAYKQAYDLICDFCRITENF